MHWLLFVCYSWSMSLFSSSARVTRVVTEFCIFPLQLVVRQPSEPSHKFEWGSHYVLIGDYMKAKECFHDAVSIQQAHQPRL